MPSLGSPGILIPLRAVTILTLLLLAAHAPVMLNDGLVMDDWLVLKPRLDYVVDIDFLLSGAGHPIFFSYDTIANFSGNPILLMKVLALAGILFGAISLVLAATRLNLLDWKEAIGFALIVWTYPGYQMWAGKANAVYVFSFGLLFVGAWLFSLAFSARGVRRIVLRIAAALVFLLSFALNSTVVLYAFVMLGLFAAIWRAGDSRQGPIRRAFLSAWRCAAGYPEFVVLPLIYFGALSIWFRRVGVYAGHYNAHFPSLPELVDGWRAFFLSAYKDVLVSAARAARDSQVPFILATALIVLMFFPLRSDEKERRSTECRIVVPLLLGPVLFLMLSLPYLVAGLRPAENFYESRHLLMFGVPLALSLVAIKRLAEVMIGAGTAFAAVFGLASILSIAVLWNGYVFMQARALKQEALSSHLAGMARPAATVFAINDGFLDYPSRYAPFGVPEATGRLRLAWGDQPFLGFTLRTERPTILQEMEELRTAEGSAYHHIDPSGPQATITFQPGPDAAPNAALVRHYYACRLLGACNVSEFLRQLALVKIDVGPIDGLTPLVKPN